MFPFCHFCEKSNQCPKQGFATTAIHFAQEPWECGAVVVPIVNSSTFKQPGPYEAPGYKNYYGRCGNPTRDALEGCLAALDNGTHGLCFATGMAAITTIAMLMSCGDHMICGDDIYGGTYKLFHSVTSRLGIETTFVDCTDLNLVEKAIKKNTKMIWIETPTNPTMKVIDIFGVSKIAKSQGNILVAVDNTFLTPYFQKPLDCGADIAAYSLTKFMNGHTDVVMGAAVVKNEEIANRLRFLQIIMGTVPSPFDCFLVNRSLKTLAVRMEQHQKSALNIAVWLKKHPKVATVLHPGLPGHPQEEITKRQTTGQSSVFSFAHTGGLQESKKFLKALKIFILAVSLGGYESLAELPSTMTHAGVPEDTRQQLGITDALIRLSIGLEDEEDLINDLDQALEKAFEK